MALKRKVKRKAAVVKPEAKRGARVIERKAKPKAVMTKRDAVGVGRNAKLKIKTTAAPPPVDDSNNIRRVPSMAEVDGWVARAKAEKEFYRKQEIKQRIAREKWLASDQYKALAKRGAVPTTAGRKQKPPSKPGNPTEARTWLGTVVGHVEEAIKAHRGLKLPLPVEGHDVAAYAAARMQRDQWLSDMRRLRWFVDRAKAFLASKEDEKTPDSKGDAKTLGKLLGFEGRRGSPGGPKPLSDLTRKVLAQRETESKTRKTRQGKPAPPPYKTIGDDNDMSEGAARKRAERAAPKIAAEKTAKIVTALRQRFDSKRPIETAKARSAARGKEIRAHNRRQR